MGTWHASDRKSRLPSNWTSIVKRIRARDGERCTWVYRVEGERARCAATTRLEVDHIRNNDDHSDANLRTLCHDHHAQKTQSESWASRSKNLAKAKKKFRRTEEHPALAYMRTNGVIPTPAQ